MTTNDQTLKNIFLFVKDTSTGRISRVVVPGDLQVGLLENPAALDLTGRFSVNVVDYDINQTNKGIIDIKPKDTIVSLTMSTEPDSGEVVLNLPNAPKNGQLHFIKDSFGSASTIPIRITPPENVFIDGEPEKEISSDYGSLAVFWSKDSWKVLISASVVSGSGGGGGSESYITVNSEASLANERSLAGSSAVTVTDLGAGSSVVLDLSTTAVSPGSYDLTRLTVDSRGRLTAAASRTLNAGPYVTINDDGTNISITGSAPSVGGSDPAAQYLVLSNTASLSNERQFVAGTGLRSTDSGANSTFTLAVNDGVVATLTGSVFSGAVSAPQLTGSHTRTQGGLAAFIGEGTVSISTNSSGQVVVSGSGGSSQSTSGGGDPGAQYIVNQLTASLPNALKIIAGPNITISSGSGNLEITGSAGSSLTLSTGSNVHIVVFSSSSINYNSTTFTGVHNALTTSGFEVTSSLGITFISGSSFLVSEDGFYEFNFSGLINFNNRSMHMRIMKNTTSVLHYESGYGNSNAFANEWSWNRGFQLVANDTLTLEYAAAAVGGGAAGSSTYAGYNTRYTNIKITKINSFVISGSLGGADSGAQYLVLSNTASLSNERQLSLGTGLSGSDGGANSTYTLTINDGVVATLTGSVFSGAVSAPQLTGSLTRTQGGLAAIEGSGSISVTTNSSGQVIVAPSYTSNYGTFAAKGSAGNAGRLYISTDSFITQWIDNGTAWCPLIMGQVIGVQPPDMSNFTAFNSSGTLSASWNNGTIALSGTIDVGSEFTKRGYIQPFLTTDVYCEVAVAIQPEHNTTATRFTGVGIIFREAATQKSYSILCAYSHAFLADTLTAQSEYVEYDIMTNDTTRASFSLTANPWRNAPTFFRLERLGTNLNIKMSRDRMFWTLLDSRTVASVFTTAPDQVGLTITSQNVLPVGHIIHYVTGTL